MELTQIYEMKFTRLIQYYNDINQAITSNDFSIEDKKIFRFELKKINMRIKKFNGLTYIVSRRIGECGISGSKLYVPFFLMGTCGDDRGVVSWSSNREFSTPPTKMDYKWFQSIAQKLEDNPNYDWDWEGFRNNILLPNREHIKKELGINDKKIGRLFEDGMVFLNNFNKTWKNKGDDGEGVGLYPSFKNFLECNNLNELEY